jgi:hypothetical protein
MRNYDIIPYMNTEQFLQPQTNSQEKHSKITELVSIAKTYGLQDIVDLGEAELSLIKIYEEGDPLDSAEIKETHINNLNSEKVEMPLAEYLNHVKQSPPNRSMEEKHAEWNKERISVELKIRSGRVQRQTDEEIQNGVLEEIGYFPMEEGESSDKAYLDNVYQGYKVSAVPRYNSENLIVGHNYYRTKIAENEALTRLMLEIEKKYEQECKDQWFYEEQEKDLRFQERVRTGTMAYLGEVDFDGFVEMRKSGLPHNLIEKVVVFDEQKEPSGRGKIFALI